MKRAVLSACLAIFAFIAVFPCAAQDSRGLSLLVKKLDPGFRAGKQYLLLIAVDNYQSWPALKNPVRDAKEIKELLTSRYYVDEATELYNDKATKAGILKAFEAYQKKLTVNDSLLVYYAGHGHLDAMTNTGFWIPVNAGLDKYEQGNWLPNTQIRGIISSMKSIHLLVISDSCFSGELLNSSRAMPDEINNDYFKKAYARISRQILTSGASEAVPDESEFSRMLKLALMKNNNPYFDPLMLYNEVRLGVRGSMPLFGNLKDTGHQEGASFLLFLKEEPPKEIARVEPKKEEPKKVEPKVEEKKVEAAAAPPPLYFFGFETGSRGDWNAKGGARLALVDAPAHTGRKSLLVSARKDTWHGPEMSLTALAQAGATYELGLWVWLDRNAPAAQAQVMNAMLSSGAWSTRADASPRIDLVPGAWTRVRGRFTRPAGLDQYTVFLEVTTVGVSYRIDDVEISEAVNTVKDGGRNADASIELGVRDARITAQGAVRPSDGAASRNLHLEETFQWTINVPADGDYTAYFRYACHTSNMGSTVKLSVDDQSFEYIVKETGSWEDFTKAKIGMVRLKAGMHTVVVQAVRLATVDATALKLEAVILERSGPLSKSGPADSGQLTTIVLTAREAQIESPKGNLLRLADGSVTKWKRSDDRLKWKIQVPENGEYEVHILYTQGQDESSYMRLSVGDQTIDFLVRGTGSEDNFAKARMGKIRLSAGVWEATLFPLTDHYRYPIEHVAELTFTRR